jgi:DNA primase catalytic core
MARRIPQDELEALKSTVSLKALFAARGVELKKAGKDGEWLGLCCFHQESSPSLHVSEDKGLYHCFGCGAKGDALTLLQQNEAVSFRQAVEMLRAGYSSGRAPGGAAGAGARGVKRSTALKLPALAEVSASDRELMLEVVRFYHENLLSKSSAQRYLERRGIGSREAIEQFSIGFSDRTLGYRLPASNRTAGASLRSRLQALGIYGASGHERMRGCITVPLFDEHGAVVQMYGRRISEKVAKDKRHLLLPFPRAGIFNREGFAEAKEIIVCEGVIDALSWWCAGFRNVTASLGAAALGEEHVRCFSEHGIERAFVAFDGDEGGRRGTLEATQRLMEAGVECWKVEFPAGLDANEFALRHAPAAQSLGQLLRLAQRLGPSRSPRLAAPTAPAQLPSSSSEQQAQGQAAQAPAPESRGQSLAPAPSAEPRTGAPPASAESGSAALPPAPAGTGSRVAAPPAPADSSSASTARSEPAAPLPSPAALVEGRAEWVSEASGRERERAAQSWAARTEATAAAPPASSRAAPAAIADAPSSLVGKVAAPSVPAATNAPTAAASPAHAPSSAPAPAASSAPAPARDPKPPEAAGAQLEGSVERLLLVIGERLYVVRGLAKNSSLEQLRVNLRCERGELWHQDNIDLYSAQRRRSFIKQAATELELEQDTIKTDLGKLLRALEERHEQLVHEAMAPKRVEVRLSEQEQQDALALLKDPRLAERIARDLEECGLVGERASKLLAYLVCVSRLLQKPLGMLVQSSSAAGKSTLAEAVLAFMPPESVQKFSALTAQALYYLGEGDLAHKILFIAEDQGSQRATYSLKLLLSEGKLSIAAPGKDPVTGKLVTNEYCSEGPTAMLMPSTSAQIDEELQNRCIVTSVDESREQTRAIHRQQRHSHSLEGLWAREGSEHLKRLHQNAQRLLEPVEVVNPYERHLTFLDDRTRTRRDHLKYLTLIDAIALLHQYQRPRRRSQRYGQEKEYVEVELSDIALANELASEALGRSLDELPPQTRRLLEQLERLVLGLCAQGALERCDVRFSRRDVRRFTGWSYDQVRVHLDRLVELEYVLVHRGGRGQSFVYELLYDGEGQDGRPFVLGLLDVEKLRQLAGQEAGGVDSPAEVGSARAARIRSRHSPEQGGAADAQAAGAGASSEAPEATKKTLWGQDESLGPSLGAHLAPIGVGFGPPWGEAEQPMASASESTFEACGSEKALLGKDTDAPAAHDVAGRRNGSGRGKGGGR